MTPNLLLVLVCSKFATAQVLPASTYNLASPYSRLQANSYSSSKLQASPYTFSYVPPKALIPWMVVRSDKECQTCSNARSALGGHPSDPRLRAGFPLFATETLPCCNETTTTTTDCTCGKTTNTRIVGGTETKVNKYPWIALLSMGCGGSLIADKWILTAAHCFYDGDGNLVITDPTTIEITLGEHDISKTTETTLTKVVTPDLQIIHSGYNFALSSNDIALLRLPSSEDLTVYTPVCLPQTGAVYTGKNAWVYGWGDIQGGGPSSDTLQEVEVPIVADTSSLVSSLSAYQLYELTNEQLAVMIFAGIAEGGKDACQGDSGGPLSYDNNGKHEQAGVVSWGIGCARPNLPGAYADVAVLRAWIDQQLASNGGAAFCQDT